MDDGTDVTVRPDRRPTDCRVRSFVRLLELPSGKRKRLQTNDLD